MTERLMISKTIKVVILVAVFLLISSGISAKGFGPLKEDFVGWFDDVLFFLGFGEDGDSGDCNSFSKVLDSGVRGDINVCRDRCSFEMKEPSGLLGYEEFVLRDEGYSARKVGSEIFDNVKAFGTSPYLSDLHRDAYLELDRVVDEFLVENPDEEFLKILELDFDAHFRITMGNQETFTWNGEIWRKGLKGVELYSADGEGKYETMSEPLHKEGPVFEGVWAELKDKVDLIGEVIPELDIRINRDMMRIELKSSDIIHNVEFYLNEDETEILTDIPGTTPSKGYSVEKVLGLNYDNYFYTRAVVGGLKETLDRYNSEWSILLEHIKEGHIIKDEENIEYRVDTVTKYRPDKDLMVIFNAYETISGDEIKIEGALGSTLKAQGYERVFYTGAESDDEISISESLYKESSISEGVWPRFRDYVNTKKNKVDTKGNNYNIWIDEESRRIKFISSNTGWFVLDVIDFYLNESGSFVFDFESWAGEENYFVKDMEELGSINKQIREIAMELSAVFDDYILSLSGSDEDVFSEIYKEYDKRDSNIYWNYVGDGTKREFTFGSDINLENKNYNEKEFREWLDEITKEVDNRGDDSKFFIGLPVFSFNTYYNYMNGQWKKKEALNKIFEAYEEGKNIALHYNKVGEEELKKWLNGMTKKSAYSKNDQENLLSVFSEYLEGVFVNWKDEELLVKISKIDDSGRNRILIYFEDDEGERFGVYSDGEKLVLTFGDEADESPVSDGVILDDNEWEEFLKINEIYQWINSQRRKRDPNPHTPRIHGAP